VIDMNAIGAALERGLTGINGTERKGGEAKWNKEGSRRSLLRRKRILVWSRTCLPTYLDILGPWG